MDTRTETQKAVDMVLDILADTETSEALEILFGAL
jgi:hypothetical protein